MCNQTNTTKCTKIEPQYVGKVAKNQNYIMNSKTLMYHIQTTVVKPAQIDFFPLTKLNL